MRTRPSIPMRDIRSTAKEIGKLFRVQRIVLFGSHARGAAQPGSDVDLLIIAESRRPIDLAARILLHIGGRFDSDVVVRTPREVRRALRAGDPFLSEILREGNVLYAPRRTRVG